MAELCHIIYIIFLISTQTQKHRFSTQKHLGEVVLTIYVLSRNMKNRVFLSEKFQFLEVKFSIYLNRLVFVMIPIFIIFSL